jgi:protein-tyrosine phosphatase
MNSYNPDTQLVKELALINCRELGGMPLAGGKTFRTGLFLRSGSPEWLSQEQYNKVKGYGVKTVIDLRATDELKGTGNPFEKDPDIKFYSIPLLNSDPNGPEDKTIEYIRTHTLGDYYVIIGEEMGERLAEIMRVLLNNDGLLLFHCAHGKDRTGVAAMLILLALGVSEEIAKADYLQSNVSRKQRIDRLMKQYDFVSSWMAEARSLLTMIEGVLPESADMMMSEILERYGTYENFMDKEYGLDEVKLRKFRDIYLE